MRSVFSISWKWRLLAIVTALIAAPFALAALFGCPECSQATSACVRAANVCARATAMGVVGAWAGHMAGLAIAYWAASVPLAVGIIAAATYSPKNREVDTPR